MAGRFVSVALGFGVIATSAAGGIAWSQAAPDSAPAAAVAAQNLPELVDGKRTFTPAWFASDSPQTARDMVARIPGFAIEDGGDARGFGANAGNVLIDGQRPTTKSQGLGEALNQIPAGAVLRIELLEGAAATALAPGKSLVVNVVRDPNAVSSGNLRVQVTAYEDGHLQPNVDLSYAMTLGGYRLTAGLEIDESYNYLVGQEGLEDPTGRRLEWGGNLDERLNRSARINFGAQRTFGNTRFSGNASFGIGQNRRDWSVEALRPGEALAFRRDNGSDDGDAWAWEVGGDLTRPLAGWETRLAVLAKREGQDSSSTAGFNLVGRPLSYDRFSADAESFEQIARVTTKRTFGEHQFEFGGEYARNGLEIASVFATGDGLNFITQPGSISNTEVEEARWEAFIANTWTISPTLSLETTITNEWSTITQSGDAAQERSFTYLKPRVKLTWQPDSRWTVRAEVQRAVGQLDFGAFADSAQVGDGNQNRGNPNLRPEQATISEVTLERRWGRRGSLSASYIVEDITDHLTLVFLGSNIGLGNVPDATRHGYNVSATIPLDSILAGLETDFNWRWRNSEVTDPLSGRSRNFGGWNGKNFEVGLRRDVPGGLWRYGAWYWRGDHSFQYRPAQEFEWKPLEFWGAWVQRRNVFGMTAELGVETPFGNTFRRYRYDYTPDRRSGQISQVQYRDRDSGFELYLELKRNF